jgi:uncharacterized membrane protein
MSPSQIGQCDVAGSHRRMQTSDLIAVEAAIVRSVSISSRVVLTNPGPIAVWGMVIAGRLVLGTAPLFLGLIFVTPMLCRATWHLYRQLVMVA